MRKLLKLVLPLALAIALVISGGIALADTVVWSENWDSYSTGQDIHGVGGWKGWDNNPAFTAYTSDVQSVGLPNSIEIAGPSDLVHEFSYNDGLWVLTAQQFVPSDFTGVTYFLLMNEYADGGPYSWASQVEFDGGSNLVVPWYGSIGTPLPLIKGTWVEIRVEIDLDADWQRFYYDGDLLYQCAWTWALGGPVSLAAIDLFANAASPVYYDDLSIASTFWSENWDSYPTGQDMHGVGGWKGWDNNPAFTAYTSSVQSLSSPNSIDISGSADLVHEFSYNDGVWVLTAQQFVPSEFTGITYFVLMNEYTDGGPYSWASQVEFDGGSNLVVPWYGFVGTPLPLIKGAWVEILVTIDMDADWQKFYYGGDLLYECAWTWFGGGPTSLAAIDLFGNGSSSVYYDDLSIAPTVEYTNTVTVEAEVGGTPLAVPIDWSWDSNSSTDTTSFDITDIPDGTELSLTAPAMHTEGTTVYVFDHWSVGGTDYGIGDVDITFEVDEDLTAVAHYGYELVSKSFCGAEIQFGEFVKGKWNGGDWIPVSEWHALNGGTGDEQWYPKNQRIRWPVTFSLLNHSGEDWTDVVLRDHFGAELELLDMEYELDGVTYEVDEIGVSNLNKDPAVDENGIGFYTNKGASRQLRFIWEVGDLPAGQEHTLTFYVVTDLNPGQGKKDLPKWEFTSCGIHTLNSGATLEWTDEAGIEHVVTTEGWAIQVCKPTPVVTTEIQAPMIGDVAYILLEDFVQDEATVHSLEGVRGVNCDWYPSATGDVTFEVSLEGTDWLPWGIPIELTDGTVISQPIGFMEVGRYYIRAVFESDDSNYGDSASGALDEPLEVIELSMVVEKTGTELSKIGDLVSYNITIENTSSGNVPPMFFDIVDAMLGIDMTDVPIALGDTFTVNVCDHEIPDGADDPYVNEVMVHATVEGLPYEIDGDDSWETNLFQPSFDVTFEGDEVVGVGDEIEWAVRVENTSSSDAPDALRTVINQFTGMEAIGVLSSGESTLTTFYYTTEESDRPQIEATLTVEITYDDFPNVFNYEETLITIVNSPPVADFSIDYTPISHCDQPVYFTDLSTDPDGDTLDYLWDFGDGEISHQQNPSHDYASPGTYTVELTVTDPYGGWDSITRDVEVTNSPPVADFNASPTYLSWCDTVYFTNMSGDPDSCDILDYYWDFGDGWGYSYDTDPSYSYSYPGIFTVTLTVTDSLGESDSYDLDIEVYNDPPDADFSVDGPTTRSWCDQPFQFFNYSDDPDSCEGISGYPLYYEWDFDNDGVVDSTEFEPTWEYAWPGTYEIELRVIDNLGSWDSDIHHVTVTNEVPVADFDYGPPDPDVGDWVDFNNNSYDWDFCDMLSYEWDFDDGSYSYDTNPSHIFSYAGDYHVELKAMDQFGVFSYYSETITVSEPD